MTTQLLSPTHTVNFAKILPLFRTAKGTDLIRLRPASPDLRLAKLGGAPRDPTPLRLSRLAPKAQFQPLKSQEFSVGKVSGAMSRAAGIADVKALGTAHLALPFGMPRFVNVATLKKMLKAKPSELMLKRVGTAWEVCENSTRVDLADDSVEFRLGLVQVFS